MNLLKETQTSYSVEDSETQKIINSLNEIKKIRNMSSIDDDDEASKSDRESEQQSNYAHKCIMHTFVYVKL
jgi:hypothetical protein